MINLFKDKIIAINILIEKDEIKGYAVVSKDNAIFFSTQLDILKLLKLAKKVIYFDLKTYKKHFSEFPYKYDIATLFYQLNPTYKFDTLEDLIKKEFYYKSDDKVTYLIEPLGAKDCIRGAQFILDYYLENYSKAHTKSLKLDQDLNELCSIPHTINIDKGNFRIELSALTKAVWDLERELWGRIGFPITSLMQLQGTMELDEDIYRMWNIRKEYKALIEELHQYADDNKLQIYMNPLGSSTGRIICRDQKNRLFSPNNDFKKLFLPQDVICENQERCFLSFDYSKQEASILARVSQDGKLKNDLTKREFYKLLAKKYLLEDDPNLGKNLFYALVYGSKPEPFSKKFKLNFKLVSSAFTSVKRRYLVLFNWIKHQEFKTNCFGRPLHTNTINAYIQSTAADIVKRVLLKTKDFNPILVFSDNIIYDVVNHPHVVHWEGNEIKNIMENIMLDIEFKVKGSMGKTLKMELCKF